MHINTTRMFFLLMIIINVAVNTMSTIIDRFPSRSRSMSGVPVTRLQRIVSSMIILFVYFLLSNLFNAL